MNKKRNKLILLITWMLIIFIMSSFDGNTSGNQSNFIVEIISRLLSINNITLLSLIVRKLAHFTEYLILGYLMHNYLEDKHMVYIILLCILYAISDEIHQIFVSGRVFAILDILIDSLGSIIGIIIYNLISHKS